MKIGIITGGRELSRWSKQELLETFSPGALEWQQQVIDRGVILANKYASLLGMSREDIEEKIRSAPAVEES